MKTICAICRIREVEEPKEVCRDCIINGPVFFYQRRKLLRFVEQVAGRRNSNLLPEPVKAEALLLEMGIPAPKEIKQDQS